MTDDIKSKTLSNDLNASPSPSRQEEGNDPIQRAIEAADKLEKQNQRMAELIAQQQKLGDNRILGGRSEAGIQAKPKSKKEQYIEDAQFLIRSGNNPYAGKGAQALED